MNNKLNRKNLTVVALENRCRICDTKLTLYPKDFAECPHCQKKVCRQCWANAWPDKAFSSENCSHLAENDGLNSTAFTKKEQNINWDWPRIALAGIVLVLVLGVLGFLINLLVF